MPIDPAAFRAFEHAGWQAAVDRYEAWFGPLTAQTAAPLLDVAGVGPAVRVLDEASGPGHVSAAAARRGATVVGIDFAPAMVAAARERYPDLDFREADAEALPFGAGEFDAVVVNFGILHLGRPEQALIEARRVLRAGGTIAFTAWSPPEVSVGFGLVLRAIQAHGKMDVPLPTGPPFFRFGDPAESTAALSAAGFVDPRAEAVSLTWRLPTADALIEAFEQGTVRTAGLLRAQDEAARTAIRAAVREAVGRYVSGGGVEIPMGALVSSARAP